MAADLTNAAVTAYTNLMPRWIANTIKANLLSFASQLATSFDEQDPNDRPILNWGAIIAAQATQLPALNAPIGPSSSYINNEDVSEAAQAVYSVCFLTQYLADLFLISASQAAAVLAAYNAFIE